MVRLGKWGWFLLGVVVAVVVLVGGPGVWEAMEEQTRRTCANITVSWGCG